MKTERLFRGGTDRYSFDFNLCTVAKGYAQVDTAQDASYFGTWANPFNLKIVSYAEGDITIQTAEDIEEFACELRNLKAWNDEHGWAFKGIDPGFDDKLKQAFIDAGLKDLLH